MYRPQFLAQTNDGGFTYHIGDLVVSENGIREVVQDGYRKRLNDFPIDVSVVYKVACDGNIVYAREAA